MAGSSANREMRCWSIRSPANRKRPSPRTVLRDDAAEKRVALGAEMRGAGIARGILADRGGDHDQLERRVDIDRLAVDAEQHEAAMAARQQPDLQAVAAIGAAMPGHLPRPEGRRLARGIGHVE